MTWIEVVRHEWICKEDREEDVRPVEPRHLGDAIDNVVDARPLDVGRVALGPRLKIRRGMAENKVADRLE